MRTIGAILTSIKISTIHAILIIAGISQKIAILHIITVVAIVTIRRVELKKTQSRSGELELLEFGNKIDGHRKIV